MKYIAIIILGALSSLLMCGCLAPIIGMERETKKQQELTQEQRQLDTQESGIEHQEQQMEQELQQLKKQEQK